jgi:hypothetical protein
MSPAASTPTPTSTSTLALVCYPAIWSAAAARPPRGPGYCWQQHFCDLVATARTVREAQPLVLRLAGDSEQWFIGKLAAMTPPEVEITIMMIDAKQRPDPLAFLNPDDPCVPKPKAAEPIRHRGEPPDALA